MTEILDTKDAFRPSSPHWGSVVVPCAKIVKGEGMNPIKDEWRSPDGSIRLLLGDCLEILPTLEAGSVDAVVTDPPYGISHPINYASRGRGKLCGSRDYGKKVWDNPRSNDCGSTIIGDDRPFDPSMLLELKLPTVLWGGNWFASRLPDSGGWLVWDKERPDDLDQATCELAWTNCIKGVRRFRHLWNGMMRASEHGESYHPTQKPVALFAWILSLRWIPSGTVLDPYMGSGPCGVACARANRQFIGIEIDPTHYATAVRRCQDELNRTPLFDQPRKRQGKLI